MCNLIQELLDLKNSLDKDCTINIIFNSNEGFIIHVSWIDGGRHSFGKNISWASILNVKNIETLLANFSHDVNADIELIKNYKLTN